MKNTCAAVIAATYVMTGAWALRAQQPAADRPRYGTGDTLMRPADYREWPFLGAGLGLTYEPESVGAQSTAPQMFSNVFVNPSSVQFYPTLLDVARAKGTLKPGY